MDIPTHTQAPQQSTASNSNLGALFGLGVMRRDTTSLADLDTFSIGEKGHSASGKGKTKSTVTMAERLRSRLSLISSVSLGSEPVDELYDGPWRKEMYEALASLTR